MLAQGCHPWNDFELDVQYAHPTRAWFLGPFARAVSRNTLALGLNQYRPEANDCDKFTRRAAQWARDCHALTRPDSGMSLAVGDFFYTPGAAGGGGHAIVCAIVYEQDAPRLVFLEPQTGLEARLTREEIQSCYGFIF